jgi:hypothetical protein
MTAPTNLKPCPFCGGEAEIIRTSVHCNSPTCEAQPFTAGQSVEEAIAAWNRRASDAELPVGEKVALDIAKWFVQGDRPDEWKLKEWAEALDRDAIGKAYEDLKGGSGERGE